MAYGANVSVSVVVCEDTVTLVAFANRGYRTGRQYTAPDRTRPDRNGRTKEVVTKYRFALLYTISITRAGQRERRNVRRPHAPTRERTKKLEHGADRPMPSRRRLATEVVLPNPIFRHTSGVWPERLAERDPVGSEHGPTWSVVIGAPYARVPFFLETEVHHENIMRPSVTKWPNKSCCRILSPTRRRACSHSAVVFVAEA